MSTPETDFDLELHFLPAWAQKSPDPNRYAKYVGEPAREGDREQGRRNRPPPRRDRPAGRQQGAPSRQGPGDRSRPHPRQDGPRGRDDRRPGQGDRRESGATPAPLPELNVAFIPDDHGVDSLARQIKMTGRAYPLFEIAQMILQKPERHAVTFSIRKKPDGSPVQPLFLCALDDTLWLSEEEAIRWVLEKHFNTFYQPERTQIEAPKGTYTFVAQCGMSGAILGPPNYHDYQNQLRKLHTERFSRMPFEAFKARVKIVKDEAVVKKWLEEQSWKTQYVCLNLPEPLKLGSREEVEKHFRQTHLSNIITPVETSRLGGSVARLLRSPALLRLLRQAWEDQRRFPLQIATVLSQQFAGHGLQFFKVNRTVTHVAVARPHYLDLEATPVSEGIKRIVNFINATPKCTRRRLFEALAPGAALPEQASPTGSTEPSEPSPEQTAVISDLHWLVHQGHVIEFANGLLEMAKKPLAKPAKPPAAATPAEAAPGEQTETGAPTTNDLMPPPAASAEPESLAVAPGELAATAGPIQPEPAADRTEEPPPSESR